MNGTTDFVAKHDEQLSQGTSAFPVHGIDIDKVYNFSLSLKRFDDPATAGQTGDTISPELRSPERSTGEQWSFGDYERVTNSTTMLPDGFSSDAWDYFVMQPAERALPTTSTGSSITSKSKFWAANATLNGDYNGDGKVDAADYVAWRKDPADHGGTPDGYNTLCALTLELARAAGLRSAAGSPGTAFCLAIFGGCDCREGVCAATVRLSFTDFYRSL